MNIFIAILFWMIGLRLQMSSVYYVIIIISVFLQFLLGYAKNNQHDNGGQNDCNDGAN